MLGIRSHTNEPSSLCVPWLGTASFQRPRVMLIESFDVNEACGSASIHIIGIVSLMYQQGTRHTHHQAAILCRSPCNFLHGSDEVVRRTWHSYWTQTPPITPYEQTTSVIQSIFRRPSINHHRPIRQQALFTFHRRKISGGRILNDWNRFFHIICRKGNLKF
ncbi:hypothetical protein GWK47_043922 [Chionoecetes opilio]|uniref:Uncharacterized protein n=1 Tax=Chionoecetes opilio TaxID=41210 RepID=A0A8J4Y8X4_CHIOP|nr:hypothetical protein GWK47_043922 [Chionoecetes opilio]